MLSKNKQVDLNSIKEKGQLNTQILNPDFYFGDAWSRNLLPLELAFLVEKEEQIGSI